MRNYEIWEENDIGIRKYLEFSKWFILFLQTVDKFEETEIFETWKSIYCKQTQDEYEQEIIETEKLIEMKKNQIEK